MAGRSRGFDGERAISMAAMPVSACLWHLTPCLSDGSFRVTVFNQFCCYEMNLSFLLFLVASTSRDVRCHLRPRDLWLKPAL